MQGRRTGKLTDEETYRLVNERGAVVRELAEAEGVANQAIYMRLARERRRRAGLGLEVHHGKRGRKPALPKGFVVADEAGVALAGQALAEAGKRRYHDDVMRLKPVNARGAQAMYDGIFDGLNEAIARLEVGAPA